MRRRKKAASRSRENESIKPGKNWYAVNEDVSPVIRTMSEARASRTEERIVHIREISRKIRRSYPAVTRGKRNPATRIMIESEKSETIIHTSRSRIRWRIRILLDKPERENQGAGTA
jgi:hypothetical protein